jgi:enoyl-CoA hydratase/carnithine racemase
MSQADPVGVRSEGDIAYVTIARPERANALDAETARRIGEAISALAAERVVVLTGEGKAFCAGGDLEELERWADGSAELITDELYGGFQAMVRAIRASDAIVIAAVNGAAVGAGMDLALACDLRIAGESARFGQVWVGLGVIPGTGGAWLTQHLAGPTRAAELLLTADIISAEEALSAGLVNAVVPDERLLDEARALAARILRHPREGVVANKRAIVAATEAALEAALEHAAKVQPERFTSHEFRRALRSRRR